MQKKNSTNVEHYTPSILAHAILGVLGGVVDCDPASSLIAAEINGLNAGEIFTQRDNGLSRHWYGRVYNNPPYGKVEGRSNTDIWFSKLIQEYRAGNVTSAVFLCNVSTGRKWFSKVWEFPTCFVYRRIAFISPTGQKQTQPKYDNMFVYLGPDFARFQLYFQDTAYGDFPYGIGRVFNSMPEPFLLTHKRIQQISI